MKREFKVLEHTIAKPNPPVPFSGVVTCDCCGLLLDEELEIGKFKDNQGVVLIRNVTCKCGYCYEYSHGMHHVRIPASGKAEEKNWWWSQFTKPGDVDRIWDEITVATNTARMARSR